MDSWQLKQILKLYIYFIVKTTSSVKLFEDFEVTLQKFHNGGKEKSSLFQSRLLFYRESLFIFGCLLYIRCVMEEKTKYYCLTTKLMLTTNAHLLFNGKIWPLNIVLILIPSSCVYVCCTFFISDIDRK